jgi:hypothetical protein
VRRPEPDFGEPGQRTRIERVKRQLYRMVERYPVGRHFAVLAFSSDVVPVVAKKRGNKYYPILMTSKTREEVLEQILTLNASGFTRTDLAFETAFQFEGINTIYLLSDGYPQRDPKLGSLPYPKQLQVTQELMREILIFVRHKNHLEGRRWEIHTLGFPKANLGNFLYNLAAQNYGEYSPVR